MRKLITGVDAHGRSCVVEESEVVLADPGGGHGVRAARVFATTESPPPPRPHGASATVDVQLDPGLLKWLVVDHQPHQVHPGPTTSTTMHHKDTLDLVFVLEGGAQEVLGDGPHALEAGDFVVMRGVDHAWR